MIFASTTESGEVNKLYRNLCTELNIDVNMLEEAWQAYKATKLKAVQALEENIERGETTELRETTEPEETSPAEH